MSDRIRVRSVPGGGPASRWSPSRITSVGAWVWFGLVLVVPLVGAAALLGGVTEDGVTGTAIAIAVTAFIVWVLLLAATGVGVGAANDSRVDDDVLVRSAGTLLTVRDGAAGDVEAEIGVDGRTIATLRTVTVRVERPRRRKGRKGGEGGPRPPVTRSQRVLDVDGARYEVREGAPASEDAEGDPLHEVVLADGDEVLARARTHRHGVQRDREIEVDGHLLRVRSRIGRIPPRRTLLDDEGRAWQVEYRRDVTRLTLPEEMTAMAAAFVAVVMLQLTDGPSFGAGGSVAGEAWSWDTTDSWSDSSWSGSSWSDSSWSDSSSSSDNGGWSW